MRVVIVPSFLNCTHNLGFYFFGARIKSVQKLLIKCWCNWHHKESTFSSAITTTTTITHSNKWFQLQKYYQKDQLGQAHQWPQNTVALKCIKTTKRTSSTTTTATTEKTATPFTFEHVNDNCFGLRIWWNTLEGSAVTRIHFPN